MLNSFTDTVWRYFRTGFHIFSALEAARRWAAGHCIWKVKYDNVTAAGSQLVKCINRSELRHEEAVVARKLTFIKQEQTCA